MPSPNRRVITVSNRLPIVVTRDEEGNVHVEPGSGGLVTALAPVLRDRGGMWIGWPGITEDEQIPLDHLIDQAIRQSGYELKPVFLTAEEKRLYYQGFSNEIIWPLFHDLQSMCNFRPEYWEAYKRVNRKFAEAIAENVRRDDFIWIHDYHLMGVARELRDMGIQSKMAFFLHIPFPPLDIYLKLPWRFEVLRSLLEYDLVGFQTLRDRRNFVQCVRTLVKEADVYGKGQVVSVKLQNRTLRVGAFPISIDFNEFARLAESEEVAKGAWYIHEHLPERKIVLGVDRLDYTKGIPERLEAFRLVLQRHPELQERIVLVQVVVPSRREIPRYAQLKEEIERFVGEINGQFTRSGWVPIHYIFRNLNRLELVAYYRTAEIALITPLKDGMNLVAKEYCASKVEEDGVVVLSEFAGAAAQFQRGALLVNPHDVVGVAEAIYEAYKMPLSERRQRMRRLRHAIRRYNIFWWVDAFLQAAISRRLDTFPVLLDYIPTEE